MPRFLAPITVAREYVTENETITGNETILGVTSGKGSYWDSVTVHGNLTATYGNFTTSVSAGLLYGDGTHLTGVIHDSDGRLTNSRTPSGAADGDLSGTYPNPTVAKMQGYTISTATPSTGQMLQWSGTAWVPGSIPTGGSGGGGINYFLNHGLSADNPVAGLSGTHYQLGRFTTLSPTSATVTNVTQTGWDTLDTFVTDHLDPSITTLPAGIWDLNFWASSTSSTQSQMRFRYQIYTYSESLSSTTLIATSDTYNIYDPSVIAQYVLSLIVSQTTINSSDRIFIVLQAQSASPNKDITIYYNNGRPTHLHTTIPSVGGSGLVKVINGVYQSPASLLVDVDVADNAQISQTKISGLTAALGNKFDKSLGDSVYTTVSSNSSTYVTLTGTQILKNKTIIDWMTLVRGYNTTPSLCATLTNGTVYTYIYNSSPSSLIYYRYITNNNTEDSFYSYFSGISTLSGLIATKSITI